MFKILQKTLATGIVTTSYPRKPAAISGFARGRPDFNLAAWHDARPAADACPTGAIQIQDADGAREVTIDYGRCIFCGQCAGASPDAVQITNECAPGATNRQELIIRARYSLNGDGTHRSMEMAPPVEAIGRKTHSAIREVLGRSLAIREVDAGSCNGCELEIVALNNPVWDLERFGIHFVASPRHADMLLVTGPVTRNMEMALRKTYAAMPEPKLVAATGACGISCGIFAHSYAIAGPVDAIVPVDVYIPGCPPRPEALLAGILLAIGRLAKTGSFARL